jgi:hypothetical protein
MALREPVERVVAAEREAILRWYAEDPLPAHLVQPA